jgi:ParB family chromosome partitioning protein
MAFDLAAKLAAVSKLNTGAEQIEYIPSALLDPDPDNFYSIDGLNELADSIATVGILTPLRVRQNGERYTITSGHRRRAAVQLLIDSGEDWSRGLPCIVDRGESTPEWEELKLIFANRQRVKTSAELSLEAERTDELFCALKEKGFDFPGRMQEHVAQALGVKASKLKRLHAIRGNLIPELLALYDANTINEETAYQLQQLPEGVQRYLSAQKKVKAGNIIGSGAKACVEKCETYLHPDCKCQGGSECTHTYPRFYQTISTDMGYWRCHGE